MSRMVFWIARPITIWALHFIAVYALTSAACGPRALMMPETLRLLVSLVTLIPGLVLLVFLLRARRHFRQIPPDAPEAPLAGAAFWTTLIALLAVLMNVVPVAMLDSCTG
ncbi:hypothetical protein [Roseicitreum antarcticum]|uniref:Uncharacterized protein n=1 Tax=Roseicitreum antarcticum TaxID=564137 RepID=A0A1H2VGT0_9RHOB|nr:hypothetical protein [Roseicitreum antarcticum]SDW67124.1 hypothetical protein SAMN04488238_10354 [Roseicitreum antarcticum]